MLYENKYFYTLKEFLATFTTDDDSTSPFPYSTDISIYKILDSMNSMSFTGTPSVLGLSGIKETEFKGSGTLNVLWSYIITKYQDEFIGFGDTEVIPNIATDSCWKTIKSIVYQMVATYPRYKKLLDSYAAEESKLMDQVKSYSKFNDTPQMANQYDSNEYVSTYTEYGNDIATKMARLDEIKRMYADLMNDWVDEFNNLFIE